MSNTRYDVNNAVSPYSQAKLLYISSAKFGKDWHSTPHTHSCLEIFFCVKGTGQFYIAGKYLNVGKNDLVIINPGIDHTEVSLSNAPLEYIVLGIDGVEFAFGDGNNLLRTYNFHENTDDILIPLKGILKETQTKPAWYETACKNLLELILIHLFRLTSFEVTASENRANKECSEIKRYIDSNYSENITLDYLSEIAHLNKYYLVHAFNREFNVSPINYLIQRRIRESKYLLEHTNHSLSKISDLLGFSSQSYFSQSFRRLEEMSPNEYRRLQRDKK